MKSYGHYRRDKLTCQYGCCAEIWNKNKNSRLKCDKTRRKTARQKAVKEIKQEIS
jgi:hypothetical protein